MTVKEMYDDLKHLIEGIKNQYAHIHTDLKTIEDRVTLLENKIEEKENSPITFQREIRRNNLVIFGLTEEAEEELLHKIIEFLKTILKVQISAQEINSVYRFGRSDKDRPVILKLVSFHKKVQILKQGILLKGSNISISNDLNKEDREKQKILRKHLKLAKTQGLEAKIVNFKLLLNNTVLSVEDLTEIEKKQNADLEKTQSAEKQATTSEHSQTTSGNTKASKTHRSPRPHVISTELVSKLNQTVKKPQQHPTIYSEYITRSKSSESNSRTKK